MLRYTFISLTNSKGPEMAREGRLCTLTVYSSIGSQLLNPFLSDSQAFHVSVTWETNTTIYFGMADGCPRLFLSPYVHSWDDVSFYPSPDVQIS